MSLEAKKKIEKFLALVFLLLAVLSIFSNFQLSNTQQIHQNDIDPKQHQESYQEDYSEQTNEQNDRRHREADQSFQQERAYKTSNKRSNQQKYSMEQEEDSFTQNSSDFEDNLVQVSYCTGWSYRNNYEQLAQYLRQEFPGIQVRGDNYPPTPTRQLLGKVVSFAQIGGIGLLFAGDYILNMLKINPYPQFYLAMKQKKVVSFMVIFMVGNMISGNLAQTGAFEIYYRDQTVFSKLDTGRMPQVEEVIMGIRHVQKQHNHQSKQSKN